MHGGSWARLPACERRWKERADDISRAVSLRSRLWFRAKCRICWNASSTPTRLRSATMPLACSITIRESSATSSCAENARESLIARSWRMPMVAMSAMACTTARSRAVSARAAGREEIERADHLGAQSHRHRRDRCEAALAGVGRESWPPRRASSERVAGDGRMGPVGVEAGPFFDLELDELDEPHLFARTRHVAELSVRVGEHDPGFGDVEELDATFGERLHEVDDVVGVDQGVRQRDERLDQELFAFHAHPFRTVA